MLALLLAVLALPVGAETVPVKLSWLYEGVTGEMTVHETAPGAWELWKTGVEAAGEPSPVGPMAQEQTFSLSPGDVKRAVLVFENKGAETARFFAAPHSASPAAASLGFKFKCLCVNHVYVVPPGRRWYRVVELRLSKKYAGEKLEIRHELVAVKGEDS